MKLLFTILTTCFAFIATSQTQTFFVQSVDVDPGYFADTENSMIAYNLTNQNNKLFIWLGGTNANSGSDYTALKNLSGSLGFHFINLNYIDTVPAAPLGNDPDSLVFDKFRQENVFGTPLSSHSTVDTFNSIYTRAVKMVQYLAATFPSQNWGQFLATSNTLEWSKILVGGHSQGSGHACYLAKHFPVERVLMASGPNDYFAGNNTAGHWLRQPGVTPVGRHYSYLSLNDEIVPYYKQFTNITGLGMLVNDDSTHVDISSPPYGNSHCLYTTQGPLLLLNHNSPIQFSILNGEVWTYMLTDLITLNTEEKIESFSFKLYPNPVQDILYIECDKSLIGKEYFIYDLSGKIVLAGTFCGENIHVSELTQGIYFIHMDNNRTKFIKHS